MDEIKVEIDTEVIRGKKLTDWSCYHITQNGIKKTITVEYETRSVLINAGYEVNWGTVYGHSEKAYEDHLNRD